MSSQLKVRSFNKNVSVWSGRRKQQIVVEVDYQSIRSGDFTLIHIARLQDSFDNDIVRRPLKTRFLD